ncbi:helix-turn-helix domain-containing protein [Allobaculum sp. Allo2]|nr:helix-turn-helix domain-containing protein [Allobaculum sp. Allo2]
MFSEKCTDRFGQSSMFSFQNRQEGLMPNQKHLNAVTRKLIQDGLDQGLSMAEIARQIDKSKSTVSREVKAHISFQPCLKESDSNGKAVIWDCVCIHECSPDNGICKSPCKKRKPIPCEFRDKKDSATDVLKPIGLGGANSKSASTKRNRRRRSTKKLLENRALGSTLPVKNSNM